MRKNQIALTSIVMLCYCLGALAQVQGIVTEKGTNWPVEFANVVLFSPDSAMIDGAVTDSLGRFVIQKTSPEARMLRVSCVGYKTQNIVIGASNDVHVVLEADAKDLDEIVVKAKKYVHTPEGLVANIAGSPLSRFDNGQDVLKHIPYVNVKDNDYTVIGKGTPIIYINNRQVRDNEELNQLKASDIKQVKVVLHPGAEYSSATNAVIRIITIRPQGAGLSGSINETLSIERKAEHRGDVSLNYHTGAIDIFGSSSYVRKDMYYHQSTTLSLPTRQVYDKTTMHFLQTQFNERLGFNYLKNKVSFGTYYHYSFVPHAHYILSGTEEVYNGSLLIDRADNMDVRESNMRRHTVNAYFNYDFSENTSLKFDFDFVNSVRHHDENYTQNNQLVAFASKADSRLYAGKASFNTPLLGGTAKTGAEFSFTNNRNVYNLLPSTSMSTSLASSNNQVKQWLAAYFLAYERSLGKRWSGSIGVRYEFDKADYFSNGDLQSGQSHVSNNISPLASISYNGDEIQMSLSYKYYTVRPSYFELRSSTSFNTPYSYEGGNPALEATHINMISYSLSWKDINFTADYALNRNLVQNVLSFYNNTDTISLFHPVNFKRSQSLTMSLNYAPNLFGFWTPDVSVTYYKPYINYNQDRFHHAQWSVDLDNTLRLPHDWVLGLDTYWTSIGYNTVGYYCTRPSWGMDAYVNKSFFKGKFIVRLEATNILNTQEENWRLATNGISVEKWDDMNRRTIIFGISYRFNQTRSKYKGSSASDEIKRL